MRYLKYLALLAVCVFAAAAPSQAQVSVGVGVGPVYGGYAAPVCAYGYYDYAPYACAPYGYYGPDWFYGALSDAAASTAGASQVADLDSPGEAAWPVAVVSHGARLAEVSTAAVGSTVEVAVDSTAVAEAMVAATGN
jgi:hypothetical protein